MLEISSPVIVKSVWSPSLIGHYRKHEQLTSAISAICNDKHKYINYSGMEMGIFQGVIQSKNRQDQQCTGCHKKGKKVITYIMGLMVSSTTLYIDIVHDVEEKRLKIST